MTQHANAPHPKLFLNPRPDGGFDVIVIESAGFQQPGFTIYPPSPRGPGDSVVVIENGVPIASVILGLPKAKPADDVRRRFVVVFKT